MAELHIVCPSEALTDGGPGVRFVLPIDGVSEPAFAVRYRGTVYAFVNRCAHLAVELDWNEGEFFDPDGRYLVCATHGARYYPDTGRCAGGRCNGMGLQALAVEEAGNQVRVGLNK